MRGKAWIPAHITSYFSVPPNQNWDLPLNCGSTGAGICLDKGVVANVSVSDDQYINVSHNDKLVTEALDEIYPDPSHSNVDPILDRLQTASLPARNDW